MGPINTNYQAEPAAVVAAEIYHFAHHHPLQLSHNHNPQTPCSVCTHPTSNTAYGCQHCNYYLHLACSKFPQQLQHPFDTNKTHVLMLLPKPVYPEGMFNCDACGHQGSGFTYHCGECRIDLHVSCATLPALVSVPGHVHQLSRVFAPPYANSKFMCDVCAMPGSKTWLYRCGTCLYDVHLGCTKGTQQPKVVERSPHTQPKYYDPQQQQQSYPNGYYNEGHAVVGHPANNPTVYNNHQISAPTPNSGSQLGNSISNGIANGIASAVAQAGTMALVGVVGAALVGGDAAAGAGGELAM